MQHSLQNAPLVFVHGVIAAVDGALALASIRAKGDQMCLLASESPVTALDAALTELSKAWDIAEKAKRELQNLLSHKRQVDTQDAITSGILSPPALAADTFDWPIGESGFDYEQYTPHDELSRGQCSLSLGLSYLSNDALLFDTSTILQS